MTFFKYLTRNRLLSFLLTVSVLAVALPYARAQSFEPIKVDSNCIGHFDVSGDLDEKVKWNIKDPFGKKIDFGEVPTCNCIAGDIKKVSVYKTYPMFNDEKSTVYHSCWLNNVSALNRLCFNYPKPDPTVLKQFEKWFDPIFRDEIQPLIIAAVINKDAWFNRLTAGKQNEVKDYYFPGSNGMLNTISLDKINEYNTYVNFVKTEKQFGQEAFKRKTRCICSPGAGYKYIMGPVTYALEQQFKSFKGYGAPLTWGDQERYLDSFYDRGMESTIQLDGSSFDNTQSLEFKRLIDHRIYKSVLDLNNIHVDSDVFTAVSCAEVRKVVPKCIIRGKAVSYGSVTIEGKVFSGSCDTTLMNTIRMALYQRFLVESYSGLAKDEYELWVKGDDVCIFTDPSRVNAITKSLGKLFISPAAFKKENGIVYGIGQIAKFTKIGTIIDFDFCSTMVLKTQEGYKITRKIDNITLKEHYSIKIGKMNVPAYHHDLRISANAWLGSVENNLSLYYDLVHPYDYTAKPYLKFGGKKLNIPCDVEYSAQYAHYDYALQDERVSTRNFTNDELLSSLTTMVDNTQLIAYQLLIVRLEQKLISDVSC